MSKFIFKYFAKIELVGEGLLPCRVQGPRLALETTEVEACMATYFWFVLLQIIIVRLLKEIWTVTMVGKWVGFRSKPCIFNSTQKHHEIRFMISV